MSISRYNRNQKDVRYVVNAINSSAENVSEFVVDAVDSSANSTIKKIIVWEFTTVSDFYGLFLHLWISGVR